jgi:hypothetical protein
MRLIGVLVFTALVATGFAQSSGPAGTFWLGTSLMYETPWTGRDPYTFGFGLAPVVRDRGGDNDTRIGLAAEANFFQDRQPRGLALVARLGLVDGNLYGAPGVYYVSRPASREDISFRVGALAPLGNLDDGDLLPFMLELAVGFRF